MKTRSAARSSSRSRSISSGGAKLEGAKLVHAVIDGHPGLQVIREVQAHRRVVPEHRIEDPFGGEEVVQQGPQHFVGLRECPAFRQLGNDDADAAFLCPHIKPSRPALAVDRLFDKVDPVIPCESG